MDVNSFEGLRGALMVCGTTSDAGKSQFVAGLCRLLARNGVSVAPFKAQNMALNSYVTASGHEIGRAQGTQAMAAGVTADVAMNPILLKPTGERTSQVVVRGKPWKELSAAEYHEAKPDLLALVIESLADLRSRYDVVILEGAGSPAEINLLPHDIVNLRVADQADLDAILIGDIDRGGVFAALHGTVDLLPEHLRRRIRGFVINKLRGDPALLFDGTDELERRSGVPTLGVLPWLYDIAIDAEDSLALNGPRPTPQIEDRHVDRLDVAVIRFPRLSNFTDLDPLELEPGVDVRLVERAGAVGDPDLLILPGTKATLEDLAWMRYQGLDAEVRRAAERGTVVLGICGGYQMLGHDIIDGVESSIEHTRGLGLLRVDTTFDREKLTLQRSGRAMGLRVEGYQIHHGRVRPHKAPMAEMRAAEPWLTFDHLGNPGAAVDGSQSKNVFGTTLHGLFEANEFRRAFLREIARQRSSDFEPGAVDFAAARDRQFDRLADAIETYCNIGRIIDLIAASPLAFGSSAGRSQWNTTLPGTNP